MADECELFALCSDPREWVQDPGLRHTSPADTRAILGSWIDQWNRDKLGTWVVRRHTESVIVGFGGCSIRQHSFWNLGYRFLPSVRGLGYATEMSCAAVVAAACVRPDLPVVAYLRESNAASARVAEKAGLVLVGRFPVADDAHPGAVRLVYANRRLGDDELHAVLTA
ncbi:GNAT family N-acetyltransferase [Rhodococcus sp. NBC_00297]|uniref:GNAT family N-acetyltransferase n=1 Tax=Rhodococcus sp. NBC_00297 TaxID=2976005 RepID=UPI003FA786B2